MNRIKSVLVFGILALGSLALGQSAQEDARKDPTYQELKKLLGGSWKAAAGPMPVTSRWKIDGDGTSLVGETTLGAGTKDEFKMLARFGWDTDKKQVYYLDVHGLTTVYFGHASLEKEDILLTFRGLAGDLNSYQFRMHWTGPDSYHATLYNLPEGKEAKVVGEFDWVRKKE